MLAQIYLINEEYHLFLCNSTHRKLIPIELRSFLETYDSDDHYKQETGSGYGLLTPSEGTLLAQVTDRKELVIFSSDFLYTFFHMRESRYLTVIEYAEKVGRKQNMIGKLCREGRIPGAYQKGSRWLIPEDAPYPTDNRSENPGRFGFR